MNRADRNAQRIEQILQAALQCFLAKGFHQTSMRDIAQAAGVSLGNLYNHFPGKEAIILAVAVAEGEEVAPLLQRLAVADGDRTQVLAFLQDFHALCSQPEWATLAVEVLAESARNRAVAEAFAANRRQLQAVLAEALQHLKFPPAVVFVTAYSEFALDAFKVNAIDYLVKPVETERLSQAIARVREHVSLHMKAQRSERIPVEKGGKKILIGIDKIRFVMARDDYAYLQTDTDRYFSTVSLAQLEKRLDGHGFFRVHRGYLVNLSLVEEIESVSGGTLLLTLDGTDEKIPVSRRRVSALKKALGL